MSLYNAVNIKYPGEKIKRNYGIVYYRMTATEGTFSYPYKCNGNVLWIREHCEIDPSIRRRLKEISSTLDFRWDKIYRRWNLVHTKPGCIPYIEMTICNRDGSYRPIDERVFKQLQYDMWWSAHIKYNSVRMDLESEYAMERIKQRQDDEYKEFGKDTGALLASLADARGSSHGCSKYKFPGFGESKVNANI